MHLPKAVLLDRDGVINFDSPDYILTPEQWRPIPGSLEAIAALTRAGIPVAIVSNQSALGRGMFDAVTMEAIHMRMIAAIEASGGRIAHTAYCPHAPEDDCACRKPKPGLLIETLQALGIKNAAQTIMIGDSARDVEAAMAVGVRPMLVRTGYGDAEAILAKARRLVPDIPVYDDLAAAVGSLLQEATCN
jgi:D-glycero-D-manno-heptose 1,7-bisphosphate phosphatase